MNRSTFLARLGGGALAAMLPKAVRAVEPDTLGTVTSGFIDTSAHPAYIDLDTGDFHCWGATYSNGVLEIQGPPITAAHITVTQL